MLACQEAADSGSRASGKRWVDVSEALAARRVGSRNQAYSSVQEGQTLLLLLSDQSPGRRPGLWSFNGQVGRCGAYLGALFKI